MNLMQVQSVPLFTEKGLPDGPSVSKIISVSGSAETREIDFKTDKTYGAIVFSTQILVPPGSLGIKIEIKYRVRNTSLYTEWITVKSLTGMTAAQTGKMLRLDALLGANWVPNVPFVLRFTETEGTDSFIIQGEVII